MQKKWLAGILAATGITFLGLISYSFLGFNSSDLAGAALTEGASLFQAATDPVVMKQAPKLGYLAPAFTLKDFDGLWHSLSDYRGKPVLINFWTTWCPACRAEIPQIQAFYARYQDKVRVVGVNWGQEPAAAAAFTKDLKVTYPTLMDVRGMAFVAYHLTGVPTSIFLDARGIICGLWSGPITAAEIEAGFAHFLEGDDAL